MNIKQKTVSSMRSIALDSINKIGQGHIGMAIGAAPITYTLIGETLSMFSKDPKWINRDRFVLSAGHGSMSLYSIMHFLGKLSLDDMKNHKILGSKTPSHPEIDHFDYVDATTGPLGQGVAMAVGMAISQKYLQNEYNKDKMEIINHNVFALHGDGCMQEGVALEAIQLAGTLVLDKLVLIHDYNMIQIDSATEDVNNIDFEAYFKSQNFDVFIVKEPSIENIQSAIDDAKKSKKPSYIQVHTIIGDGIPAQGTPSAHNGILNPEETIEFKKKHGIQNEVPFKYDPDVYKHGEELFNGKDKIYDEWKKLESDYKNKYPELHASLMATIEGKHKNSVMDLELDEQNVATRNYIVPIMNKMEEFVNVIGGSADLAAATKIKFVKDFQDGGKNIKYGIREFAMTAINNGIFLHSGIKTIDATFLAFADYAKPALRLGGIQEIPSIHVYTHDSYQVGGDGPTHQPVEQLTMLRSTPGLKVIRPADGYEMRAAFQYGLESKKDATIIIGCRQPVESYNLLVNKITPAYIIKDLPEFDISLLATGSEVSLAVQTAEALALEGIKARVLSVPLLQDLVKDEKLINELKLNTKPIFAIEASNDSMWYQLSKYSKFDGHFSEQYGQSAPGDVVYEKHGFTVKSVKDKITKFIKN